MQKYINKMFNSLINGIKRVIVRAPLSTQNLQQTSNGIRRNVLTNSPEFPVTCNRSIVDIAQNVSKEKVEKPHFYEGFRENPDYYTLDNIKKEIDSIEFIKEQYPDSNKIEEIKNKLYSDLELFDKSLTKLQPDFESIQQSFRLLYTSVSKNPELADVFGRFYHYQTKIYERHYINDEEKFSSVPNLNAAFLGSSIKLKFLDKSNVVIHESDLRTNIDTIKFAHEIATLRVASSILEKKIYHTADKTDVEKMLVSQGKNVKTFGKQELADAVVQQDDENFYKKDVKHVHHNKSNSQSHKSRIVRTTHSDHQNYCNSHIDRINRELADPNISLNRQIVLAATKKIFIDSKIKNDIVLLNQINENEYPFTLVVTNDFFDE